MNIKEYISSGIVESYVLGLATEAERAEFEQLCDRFPELVEARRSFEEKLEKKANEYAIKPPPHLGQQIANAIRNEDVTGEGKVVDMDVTSARTGNWSKYVAAASILLLIAIGWFAYDQYSKNKNLKVAATQLRSEIDSLNAQKARMEEEKRLMMDPNVTVVSLKGNEPSPASADIYWDTTSANVYMLVKNMPQLPSDKQYQLWAFIDGKAVDLGLFDAPRNKVMLKMNNTQRADAFAITIENRGNSGPAQGEVKAKSL